MSALANKLKSFIADRDGNIAIITSIVMIVIIGGGALGVDVGKMFADRRKAQSTADIAALVAASDLTHAAAAAAAAVSQNNFNATAPIGVQPGVYVANSSLSPSQRFTASPAASANAVRVTLQTSTPLFFGRVLVGKDNFTIQAVATATATPFASFAIGSRLLSVNGGLLNQILGQLLGTSLSLSVMDYQSLINANVDMFSFMNALATRMSVTGVTYNSLLSGNVQVGTVINALLDSEKAASGMSAAVTALSEIASALNGTTSKIPLSSLVNPGPYGTMTVGQTPNGTVSMSLFGALSAAASLANGNNQVAASLDLGLPGIASISMKLAIGQRPVGTSWVTVGSAGASVYTAQTRLLVTAQLLGSGGIAAVNVPIYVNVASGSATLTAVQCGYPNVSGSSVTLGVTPGVVDSWIGNVSASDFSNLTSAPNPGPATLVSALGISVTGLAHVAMNNMSPTPVTFSYSDIQAQTAKTVSTTSYTSSLVSQLLSSLTLNVSIGGLGLGLPSTLTQTVGSILSAQTAPLDQVLAGILQTVGIGIGQADVWVTGVRCDGAVLVN
jgi:uncharacterized membrane protein